MKYTGFQRFIACKVRYLENSRGPWLYTWRHCKNNRSFVFLCLKNRLWVSQLLKFQFIHLWTLWKFKIMFKCLINICVCALNNQNQMQFFLIFFHIILNGWNDFQNVESNEPPKSKYSTPKTNFLNDSSLYEMTDIFLFFYRINFQ